MFSKTLFALSAAIALSAATAVPALSATSRMHTVGTWMSYAQAKTAHGRVHSTNPAHDVYLNGEYLGSDPDPRIRGTILRDTYIRN